MHKNMLYYLITGVVLAGIIYYEPVFGILLIPAYIALIIAGNSIAKGNLPKDIDSYKILWKDSLQKDPSTVKNPTITIYKEGIGYLNYFAAYKDIIRITKAGPAISRGNFARMLAPFAKVKLSDRKYFYFLKIVAKEQTILFEINDFDSFKRHLLKLGYDYLLDKSLD